MRQTEADGGLCFQVDRGRFGFFKDGATGTAQNVDWANLDAMRPGVPDQLRGCIETHRLTIEQGGQERSRFVAFQPGADIDEQGETRRMALGKTVFAEPLNLGKDRLGKVTLVAPRQHAVHDSGVKGVEPAFASPGRHGAA